jgi:hypothetical protein
MKFGLIPLPKSELARNSARSPMNTMDRYSILETEITLLMTGLNFLN